MKHRHEACRDIDERQVMLWPILECPSMRMTAVCTYMLSQRTMCYQRQSSAKWAWALKRALQVWLRPSIVENNNSINDKLGHTIYITDGIINLIQTYPLQQK